MSRVLISDARIKIHEEFLIKIMLGYDGEGTGVEIRNE